MIWSFSMAPAHHQPSPIPEILFSKPLYLLRISQSLNRYIHSECRLVNSISDLDPEVFSPSPSSLSAHPSLFPPPDLKHCFPALRGFRKASSFIVFLLHSITSSLPPLEILSPPSSRHLHHPLHHLEILHPSGFAVYIFA